MTGGGWTDTVRWAARKSNEVCGAVDQLMEKQTQKDVAGGTVFQAKEMVCGAAKRYAGNSGTQSKTIKKKHSSHSYKKKGRGKGRGKGRTKKSYISQTY